MRGIILAFVIKQYKNLTSRFLLPPIMVFDIIISFIHKFPPTESLGMKEYLQENEVYDFYKELYRKYMSNMLFSIKTEHKKKKKIPTDLMCVVTFLSDDNL